MLQSWSQIGGLQLTGSPRKAGNGTDRQLHVEELHDLYSSTNVIGVIQPVRCVEHVVHMEEMRNIFTEKA
jgi:hypothetical protein